MNNDTKSLNVWSSLNMAGVGYSGDFAPKVGDLKLLASSVNNWCVFRCSNMNATQVASTPFALSTASKGGATTKAYKAKRLTAHQKKKLKRKMAGDEDVAEIVDHPLLSLLQDSADDL